MIKKLLGILLCVGLILGITGCGDDTTSDKNVSLSVKEGTLTNTGVTLIMTNNSSQDYSYGEPYYIEKEVDGNWENVETIHELVFNLPAWNLESKKSVEIDIDWEYGYGQLKSGKYRIVKEIFKLSNTNIDNGVEFNVYAEFEIDESKFEYEKATTTEIELITEITLNSSIDNDGQYINGDREPIRYNVYIDNEKLYAKNLETKIEKVVFDKEPVKNIAVRPICCTGNGLLLILTVNGNVYMSESDTNYFFSFNMKYNKLDAEDIVSFKLIPVADYDFTKNLYGINLKGEEILLHKIN